LDIWMNETERYRYAELDSHRLAAYSTPAAPCCASVWRRNMRSRPCNL